LATVTTSLISLSRYSIGLLKQFAAKGFFHLLTANLLIQLFGFGSQFFVAWWLKPEQIGQIRIMQTYLNLATIFASLGFNTSALKLCSEKRPEGEIVFLYKKAFNYTFFAVLITLPGLFLLSKFRLLSNDDTVNKYFYFYSIAIIPLVLNTVDFTYLQARKRIKEIANVQSITKLVSLVFVICLTYFLGLTGYIIAIIIGYSLTFTIFYDRTAKLNAGIEAIKLEKPFSLHWHYAKFSFLANILGQIGSYADLYLMNYMIVDKTMVGYYSFALTMTMIPRMFTSTVQQIISPYFSEKSQNVNELKVAYKKYNAIYVTSSSLIIIILFLFFPFIIDFLLSNKYHNSIIFFRLLLIAYFFQNLYTMKGYTLFGIGKINLNFYSSIIITITNLVIVYLMIIKYSILGAAYGMIISNMVSWLVSNLFFDKGIRDYAKTKKNF